MWSRGDVEAGREGKMRKEKEQGRCRRKGGGVVGGKIAGKCGRKKSRGNVKGGRVGEMWKGGDLEGGRAWEMWKKEGKGDVERGRVREM